MIRGDRVLELTTMRTNRRSTKNFKHKANRSNKRDMTSGLESKAAPTATRIFEPWMPVFPPTITRKLRYSDSFAMSGASGVPVTYMFRANDLFDPNYTGTGHQPMGFDQLMQWYNHFCVLSAKITVCFHSRNTNTTNVGIRIDSTTAALTTIPQFLEIGGLVQDLVTPQGIAQSSVTLSLGVDISKIQGVKRAAMTADSSLRGSASASPTEVTFFHVNCWNAAADAVSVWCDVLLEQVATFTEPRNLEES